MSKAKVLLEEIDQMHLFAKVFTKVSDFKPYALAIKEYYFDKQYYGMASNAILDWMKENDITLKKPNYNLDSILDAVIRCVFGHEKWEKYN